MAIKYIDALNVTGSKKKHAIVDLNDLCLDKKNPRFSSSTIIGKEREIKEEDIISYLVRFGKVSELAESINANHGLYDEEWISCYKNEAGEMVVLEGNRRVAACKILKNQFVVPASLRAEKSFPMASEITLSNIAKIKAIVYENKEDAQNYIAAKHTKPEVKKWETIEQCNYYYEQFKAGKSPFEIGQLVGEDVKKVQEKIKQFGLFKKVFDVVNKHNPEVLVEEVNILPLVTKFLPPLIARTGELGMGFSYNESTMEYSERVGTTHIFEPILLKIGEAFFVRPKSGASNVEGRNLADKYRISTDEIKNKSKVEKLVVDDIRIPGLYSLIKEYKNIASGMKGTGEQESGASTNGPSNKEGGNASKDNENSGKTGTGEDQKTSSGNANGRDIEFFSDLKYSHLDKVKYKGVVLVSEELQKISTYNGGVYKQFPIATAFLVRSLIEQVLSARLQQMGRYDNMLKSRNNGSTRTPTRTPELGNIIKVFLNDFQSGNLSLFWDDGNLGREFNKCFSGYGTKDQLDTIVHTPHLLMPDQNFLNSLSRQGLKLVMQGFLDRL